MHSKRDIVLKEVRKNLKTGIAQGLYREDLDINLVANLYIQKIKDLHDPELYESGNFSKEKVFEVMFDNHLRGIANERGLKYYEEKKSSINFKSDNNEE